MTPQGARVQLRALFELCLTICRWPRVLQNKLLLSGCGGENWMDRGPFGKAACIELHRVQRVWFRRVVEPGAELLCASGGGGPVSFHLWTLRLLRSHGHNGGPQGRGPLRGSPEVQPELRREGRSTARAPESTLAAPILMNVGAASADSREDADLESPRPVGATLSVNTLAKFSACATNFVQERDMSIDLEPEPHRSTS